jgi:hypothetical protein
LPNVEVRSLEDVPFVLKFEKCFVRTKSKSDLSKNVFDINKIESLFPIAPSLNPPNIGVNSPKASVSRQVSTPSQSPIRVMATRFSPLFNPTRLHDLPQNYYERIKTYSAEGDI